VICLRARTHARARRKRVGEGEIGESGSMEARNRSADRDWPVSLAVITRQQAG